MSTLKHLICNVVKINNNLDQNINFITNLTWKTCLPRAYFFFSSQLAGSVVHSIIKTWTGERAKIMYQISIVPSFFLSTMPANLCYWGFPIKNTFFLKHELIVPEFNGEKNFNKHHWTCWLLYLLLK